MRQLISFLFLGFFLASCSSPEKINDDDWSETLDAALQLRLEESRQYNFLPPDSLDRRLFIATYFELHNDSGGHSIILFDDSTRTNARRLTYINNKLVETDKLQKSKENEFSSVFDKAEYIVKSASVAYIKTNGNTSVSFENPRIDVNNR